MDVWMTNLKNNSRSHPKSFMSLIIFVLIPKPLSYHLFFYFCKVLQCSRKGYTVKSCESSTVATSSVKNQNQNSHMESLIMLTIWVAPGALVKRCFTNVYSYYSWNDWLHVICAHLHRRRLPLWDKCFELAAPGRKNQWQIGSKSCGEVQRTVDSLPGSGWGVRFENVRPWFASRLLNGQPQAILMLLTWTNTPPNFPPSVLFHWNGSNFMKFADFV